MTRPSRKAVAATLAALGLSSLSPVQQGAALVAAGTVALWASPALAQVGVPGVGVVVKKKPGNAPIIAHADAKGETRITGLEPGLYTVRVFEGAQEVPMRVGSDGRLAFKAWEDVARPDPRAADPRARRALPVVRRWAEQIPFDPAPSGIQLLAIAGRPPKNAIIDINAADGARLTEGTAITREGVAAIAAERARNGPFTDLLDFARRTCPQTAIDFEDASIRFGGDTMLVWRGGDPKAPGFKCARGTGEMELFGKKHNYVGHVTLLR